MKPSPKLTDCLNQLQSTTQQLIRMVDALIAASIDHESIKQIREESNPLPASVREVLPVMLQALGSSSNTVVQLSFEPGLHTRDCYSIARSIVETATNICYIIAEGSVAAERAMRHANQKSYRDLERASQVGSSVIRAGYLGRNDLSEIAGLEAEIAQFTSRTGREKGWVDLSIDERIDAAGRQLGETVLLDLHFARFMIYRHSSEILHGTFFSALYFFGVTQPSMKSRTLEEMTEFVGQQHMMILMSVVFSLSSAIEAFDKAYGFATARKQAKSLVDSLREMEYLKQAEESPDSD